MAYGNLLFREIIKECKVCGSTFRSTTLPEIIRPGCNYSYDCIVGVGRLRYIEKRQISEIQTILRCQHHLYISQTQIRRLNYSFLRYLGRLHYCSRGKIKQILTRQGGYILHVDSTCEGRGVHLLTCMDGLSGYVLYGKKIKSENIQELQMAFLVVKEMFGVPLCCVHDMGNGINSALDLVFKGVMRIICHFHLLRDIGNDLYKELHQALQTKLSKHQIYKDIRYQCQALEKLAGSKSNAEQYFFKVTDLESVNSKELLMGILYGYLQDLKAKENFAGGCGYIFDRPKLLYYKHMLEYYNKLLYFDSLPMINREIKTKCRLYKIKTAFEKILDDKDIKQTVAELEKQIGYFDRFRKILRIAEDGQKNGLNDQGDIKTAKDLIVVEKELRKYLETLKQKADKDPVKNKKLMGVVKQFEKYWGRIFAIPIKVVVNGKEMEIIPQRTNNISEQFYRKIKHLLRRLHGKPTVRKDLDFLPEEIALIENLKNKSYMQNVIGDLESLSKKFALLDIDKIEAYFTKDDHQIKAPHKLIRRMKKLDVKKIMLQFQKNQVSDNHAN